MELEYSRLFVKVVQHGSFSKAALALQIPKSTVSKAISKLEKETGTKLLLRTTRSLTLTAAGRLFYETCLGPIQVLEEAQKSLYGADNIVAGVLNITAPEDFGSHVVSSSLAELIKKYPKLKFNLRYTNEIVDLVKDGFDLAIRIGKLKESQLKAKKVGDNRMVLVASAKYLKANPIVQHPKDLVEHSVLTIAPLQAKWTLQNKKGASATINLQPRILCNQMSSLVRIAVAGGGIALVPSFVCKDDIQNESLVRVLPDWFSQGWPVSLVSPVASNSSARLKITSDHLFAAIQKAIAI